MSFIEQRLNLGIDYGTIGGPRHSTSIITDGGGGEQRNINWSQSLGKWQIGGRTLDREELDYLLDFHKNVKGSAVGFRFRDWGDYVAVLQLIGTGSGTQTGFQLFKEYKIGSNFVKRAITKIVSGTMKVYFNGTEQVSGWTIDNNTGVLTFTSPPANGISVTADFEFDVPVRFEQDKIDFRFGAADADDVIFTLDQLSLVEIRDIPSSLLPLDPVPQFISETLNLGYDYGTVGGPQFNTSIYSVGASFEKRVSNWNESRGRWNIGDRSLTRTELDYFIAFFRVARGASIGFNFYDWQSESIIPVRFEVDEIAFRFDGINLDTGEAIFYLGGVAVKELKTKEEHIESFSFTGPNKDVIYNFTFTTTNPAVPNTAEIYLLIGAWDSEGTLGYFDTGEVPSNYVGFRYNPTSISTSHINQFGGPFFVGIGKSVSGTCIEDEAIFSPDSSCIVTLKFVY